MKSAQESNTKQVLKLREVKVIDLVMLVWTIQARKWTWSRMSFFSVKKKKQVSSF